MDADSGLDSKPPDQGNSNSPFVLHQPFEKRERQKAKGEGLPIQWVLFLMLVLKTTLFSWHKECIFQRSRK